MSTTDLVPDVTDYLLAQCNAAAVTGGALAGVTVFDGEVPKINATGIEQCLWIGWNALSAGDEPFGTSTQGFAYLGNDATRRDNAGEIICTAKHWTGDTTMKVHRDGCKAIVAAVELMLRGVPPAGPGDSSMGGLVEWSEFIEASWSQGLVASLGAQATCVFKVYFFAKLHS